MTDTKDQNNKSESFPQLMNILNTLKDAMRNTSITSSGNIASQIQQLLAEYGSDPKAKEILSNLLSAATERDSKVYRNNTYTIEEQNIQAREENQQSLADIIDKAKLAAFHEEDDRLNEQHKKFKFDMQKYLAAKKHQNDLKKELLEKLENGEDVDLKKYAELIKTPEQLKKESEDRKELFKHDDEVNKHYNELVSHDQDLKKEQKKLEEDIKLKESNPPASQSPELAKKKELLQNCKNKQDNLKPVLVKAVMRKQESNDEIEKIRKEEKEQQELISNLKKNAEQTQDQSKAAALNLFASVLKDQENAIKSDGVIKNPEQHQKLANHLVLDNDQQSKRLNESSISSQNSHIPNSLKEQTTHIAENMRQKLTNKSPTINQGNTPHVKKIDDPTKSQGR